MTVIVLVAGTWSRQQPCLTRIGLPAATLTPSSDPFCHFCGQNPLVVSHPTQWKQSPYQAYKHPHLTPPLLSPLWPHRCPICFTACLCSCAVLSVHPALSPATPCPECSSPGIFRAPCLQISAHMSPGIFPDTPPHPPFKTIPSCYFLSSHQLLKHLSSLT